MSSIVKRVLKDFDELVGQTIVATFELDNDRWLITADAIAVVHSEYGYEGDREPPSLEDVNLSDLYTNQLEVLVKNGVIEQSVVDTVREEERRRHEAYQQQMERQDRATYERLKARFDPKT